MSPSQSRSVPTRAGPAQKTKKRDLSSDASLQGVQGLVFRASTYALVAVATYALTGFLQAFLHMRFGHTSAGKWLFRNHVRFHHSFYRKELTSPRYLEEERSNTAFYLVPIAAQSVIAYPLLRRDVFVVFEASMILTYLAHIYVHVHFHLTSSWLQRFH